MIGLPLITKCSQSWYLNLTYLVNTEYRAARTPAKATKHPSNEQEFQENSYAYFDPSRRRNIDGG